jgi:hypothetical protein
MPTSVARALPINTIPGTLVGVAFTLQVPLLICAVSPNDGNAPPFQLAVSFQLPMLPLTQVLVAWAVEPIDNNKVKTINTPKHFLILISSKN